MVPYSVALLRISVLAFMCILTLASNSAKAAFVVSTFTDASQLDFSGTFAYAGSIGNVSGSLPVTIGNATFTNQNALWTAQDYQETTTFSPGVDNTNLNIALAGIKYDDTAIVGAVPVTPGQAYKLQLLMVYGDRTRSNQVEIEGVNQVPTFNTLAATNQGIVSTFDYVATDGTLNIRIKPFPGGGAILDQPILNAFTLELVPEPSSAILLAWALVLGCRWRRRKNVC